MDENELTDLLTRRRRNPIHVCRVANEVARAVNSHTTAVWLSAETALKQEAKRTPYEKYLYLLTPTIIQNGYVIIEAPRHAVFIYHVRQEKIRSYKAVVKSTANGRELYLVSVHRAGKTEIRAAFKRGQRLTEWKRERREVGPPKNPT